MTFSIDDCNHPSENKFGKKPLGEQGLRHAFFSNEIVQKNG